MNTRQVRCVGGPIDDKVIDIPATATAFVINEKAQVTALSDGELRNKQLKGYYIERPDKSRAYDWVA